MAGKYELKLSSNGKYHFNLKAGNGQVILSSQMYAARDGAENGIASVRENSPNDDRYERKESSSGQPYFVLKAGNGQVIGNSEMYTTTSARDNGIESVKINGSTGVIEDLTTTVAA